MFVKKYYLVHVNTIKRCHFDRLLPSFPTLLISKRALFTPYFAPHLYYSESTSRLPDCFPRSHQLETLTYSPRLENREESFQASSHLLKAEHSAWQETHPPRQMVQEFLLLLLHLADETGEADVADEAVDAFDIGVVQKST